MSKEILQKPMKFPDRRTAEKFYLPSLLKFWPAAKVVEHDGHFIIATSDGFCLCECDLMLKLFNHGEIQCAR